MKTSRFNFKGLGGIYFISTKLLREGLSKELFIGGDRISVDEIKRLSSPLLLEGVGVSYNAPLERIEVVDIDGRFIESNDLLVNDIYIISEELQDQVLKEERKGISLSTLTEVAKLKIPALTCFYSVKFMLREGVERFSHPKYMMLATDNFRRVNLTAYSRMVFDFYITLDEVMESSVYPRIFDLYCDSYRYHSLLLKTCYLVKNKIGDKYFVLSNMGTIYFNLGELGLADKFYSEAKNSAINDEVEVSKITPFNKGFLSWSSLNDWSSSHGNDISKDYQEFPVKEGGVKCVHTVSADSNYYHKYGRQLILSSIENSFEGFVVHVNIVDPDEELCTELSDIQAQNPAVFSYSLEWLPEEKASKAYYASSRYVNCSKIMELYRCPIFVTDIDMKVHAPWSETLEKYIEYDVCLHSPRDEVDFKNHLTIEGRPWSIPAGYVFINNTPPGQYFSEYVASYILRHYSPESHFHTNWVIDQVAIRRALDKLIFNKVEFSVGRLLTQFMDAPRKSFQTKSAWVSAG